MEERKNRNNNEEKIVKEKLGSHGTVKHHKKQFYVYSGGNILRKIILIMACVRNHNYCKPNTLLSDDFPQEISRQQGTLQHKCCIRV